MFGKLSFDTSARCGDGSHQLRMNRGGVKRITATWAAACTWQSPAWRTPRPRRSLAARRWSSSGPLGSHACQTEASTDGLKGRARKSTEMNGQRARRACGCNGETGMRPWDMLRRSQSIRWGTCRIMIRDSKTRNDLWRLCRLRRQLWHNQIG